MSVYFQSVCSSSSGNCLALWTDTTRLLIDCGLSSMKRTRHALNTLFDDPTRIDSVLLTHTHTDHVSFYPLRVLEEYGLEIRIFDDSVDQLRDKHFKEYGFKNLKINPYKTSPFKVGDLTIQPFQVKHNPHFKTFGYQIQHRDKTIVIATDFSDWTNIFDYFVDADFIFVESNHDLDLLRKYYNPNSQFHLPNPDTADLLLNARQESKTPPQAVVLGHLSNQRNTPQIALEETRWTFMDADRPLDFDLTVAPLKEPGSIIRIR